MNGKDNGCTAENGSVMSGKKKKKVDGIWRECPRLSKKMERMG